MFSLLYLLICTAPCQLLSFLCSKGYDSIVARGSVEPDPSKDVVIKLEGKSVSVPQGKPKTMAAYKGSRFSNSEYLVRVQEADILPGKARVVFEPPAVLGVGCSVRSVRSVVGRCVDRRHAGTLLLLYCCFCC